MSGPALLVLGLSLTGSPILASALLAGLTVSAAVGGPLLGVLLDRSARPGRLLALCLTGYAVGLVALLAGLGRVPEPLLIGTAVLAGLLGPALAGGWTAQLPLVVPAPRLPRANALDAMTYNVAGLAGPAIVGILATAAGTPSALIAAIALILAALPTALTLPQRHAAVQGSAVRTNELLPDSLQTESPLPDARTEAPLPSQSPTAEARPVGQAASAEASASRAEEQLTSARPSMAAELMAGFRAITQRKKLLRATVVSMITCAGEGMLVVCAPLMGVELTGNAGYGALLLTGVAAGALAANATLARLSPGHGRIRRTLGNPDAILLLSTLLLAVAMVMAALAGSYAVAMIAATVAGLGEGPQLTALFAVRHREAPPRLRSQIFTTGASLKITSFALGSAVAGPLAHHSLTAALFVGAAVQLTAALTFWLLTRR